MAKLKNKKSYFSLSVALLLMVIVILAWPSKKTSPYIPSASPQQAKKTSTVSNDISRVQYPTDQASSLWAVVNKGRILPGSYGPAGLITPAVPLRLSSGSSEMKVRPEIAQALESMFAAAKTAGFSLMLTSGYRSYSDQQAVYGRYASVYGAQKADTFSARPGHSEHQTGLAADIEPASRSCELDQCFGDTAEGRWLAANSYQYGLVIRYQRNTQNLTGYEYEPWHVRYVGQQLAGQLQQSGLTLEQYFNLPTYINYPSINYAIKNI